MNSKTLLEKAVSILAGSNNTVVVTGAGISTEAGIPDFRGEKGIYRTLGEDRVMRIINIDAFHRQPEVFWDFYRRYFDFPPVEPSLAHKTLADMESKGFIRGIVTQNIDGLHEKAGNRNVIAVHGTADRFICTNHKCRRVYEAEYVRDFPQIVPACSACGGVIKPDVVLFGEAIQNYMDARQLILEAKVLVVIGSSLTVYPLAGFVKEFSSFYQDLIIINKGPTHLDHAALVKIEVENTTGEILQEINRQLQILKR
ncbi:SIR2 family NAD-dependent protein deacylase [Syntrophomonas palmitatica]|uniref:SIR2 family NAD-dependent protein deacylase n=1 Tax=Syntrophomonas palmitatica TaxID=402877 RepID=UPI0006D10110|nr:Sir2 family NAD-dependent protein deacetylase [Syntrophomonas palmitatica]